MKIKEHPGICGLMKLGFSPNGKSFISDMSQMMKFSFIVIRVATNFLYQLFAETGNAKPRKFSSRYFEFYLRPGPGRNNN